MWVHPCSGGAHATGQGVLSGGHWILKARSDRIQFARSCSYVMDVYSFLLF